MSIVALRTSNPVFRESAFQEASRDLVHSSSVMTVQGTAIKSMVLVGILLVTAGFTWSQTLSNTAEGINPAGLPYVLGGGLVGLVLGLITSFSPKASPYTAPLYAAAEGLFLGGISAMFESKYNGIVFQAVGLTVGTLVMLLVVYASGLVRVTEGFKAGVFAAMGGIVLVYLVSFVFSLFGKDVLYIHGSGPIGIGFSIFVVIIASLNLVLQFDFISTYAQRGAPKYMEWYCGFGLLVALVWLYIEVLSLLAKLSDRGS